MSDVHGLALTGIEVPDTLRSVLRSNPLCPFLAWPRQEEESGAGAFARRDCYGAGLDRTLTHRDTAETSL